MARIPDTAVNIPLALYVHHAMAAVTIATPTGVFMGMTMPSALVATRGKRQ